MYACTVKQYKIQSKEGLGKVRLLRYEIRLFIGLSKIKYPVQTDGHTLVTHVCSRYAPGAEKALSLFVRFSSSVVAPLSVSQ